MKRVMFLAVLAVASIFTTGCPADKNARDVAASLSGVLVAAQQQYQASCTANPSQTPCKIINDGINAQNALITATETYCGFALTPVPPDPSAKCVPVASAQDALQTAIANANQLVTEVRQLIH